MNFPKFILVILLFCIFLLGSPSQATADSKTAIMGQSLVTKEQMIEYFQNNNSGRSDDYVAQFVSLVINEANIEGVRPEIAFALMMKETNFLMFTGTVKEKQNNFGGLGVTGPGVQGESFDSVQIGIRAIIQHLQAYATNLPLKQQVVDPRYKYVTRGAAVYAEWLGIQENPIGKGWATDPGYGYDIVNRVNQMMALLPMRMCVDTPVNGNIIRGTAPISGWALNIFGIAKVQIFEGSNLLGTAGLNLSHPSVNVVFPGYPSGNNSGFSYALDTTKLSVGLHTLKVLAIGKNGAEQFWNVQVTVDNTPKMWVDTPKTGSAIKGLTSISGWALNMSGMSKVELYKGKTLLETASLKVYHPSVNVVYPGYPSGNNSGFSIPFNSTELPNGTQNLMVVATGLDGITTIWPLSVSINNRPDLMCVDTPTSGSTIRGLAPISGWALNMSGIAKVQIFNGSSLLGMAGLNLSHPSVNAVFPGYPSGNNSGFSYALDTTKLSDGLHTLKILAVGKNGGEQSWNIQVTVDNGPKMCVDTPKTGSAIKGLTSISGWALNMSGIAKVQIFNGSSLLGTANLKLSHPTVNVVYPGYPSGNNSGFSIPFDTTHFINGTQTLKVVATGMDGITTTWPLSVTINNPPNLMCVDTPASGSTIRGLFTISGWALNMSGIAKVQIFEGSSLLGMAGLDLSHPSVNAVFPGYPGGNNSGFSYALDTTKLSNGLHTLKVLAVGENGGEQFWNIQVRVDNGSKMCVDTPASGSTIRGLFPISGWALNMSGIAKVQIFEGSNLLGPANLNLSHPTVNVVYPGYPSGNNSGFSYTLDTTKLSAGLHTLKVLVTGNNGEELFLAIQVSVDNSPKMWVDTPTNSSMVRGVAKISGWALNMSGIAKVQIFEGSSLLGTAELNVSHPSVNVVYPGYPSGNNSGFSYTLDTTKLTDGVHTLKVQATGIDGKVLFWTLQVSVNNAVKISTTQYGTSGQGRPLYVTAMEVPKPSKVVLITFELHGWEDSYKGDGQVLVNIGNAVSNYFTAHPNELKTTSLYVVSSANPDGLIAGWTNNGPGRCQISLGVDVNRDFDYNWVRMTNPRNKTLAPFSSPEANALKSLVLAIHPTDVIDIHGWENTTFGSPELTRYFQDSLRLGYKSGLIGVPGYFTSWATMYAKRTALIELANPSTSANTIINALQSLCND